MTSLRGITWDHPRGYQGLYAATNAYHELRPDVRIEWEKHSLHHFESHPIADLAEKYDFIILDHPFMGDAYAQQCLVDLSEFSVQILASKTSHRTSWVNHMNRICTAAASGHYHWMHPARWLSTALIC